jgi:hypothetical protein
MAIQTAPIQNARSLISVKEAVSPIRSCLIDVVLLSRMQELDYHGFNFLDGHISRHV